MSEQQFDNNNRGTAFKNHEKAEEWHADYKGSINVEGIDYWLDINIKEAGENSKIAGQKFLSVKVRPKNASAGAQAAQAHQQAKANAYQPQNAAPATPANLSDDIPF